MIGDPEYVAVLDEIEWADPEDKIQSAIDAAIYGNSYATIGEDGLARRVDPLSIEPSAR